MGYLESNLDVVVELGLDSTESKSPLHHTSAGSLLRHLLQSLRGFYRGKAVVAGGCIDPLCGLLQFLLGQRCVDLILGQVDAFCGSSAAGVSPSAFRRDSTTSYEATATDWQASSLSPLSVGLFSRLRTSLRGRSYHRPQHVGQVLLEPVNVYASPILVGVVWVEVSRASASINAHELSGVIEQCRPA